MPGATDPKTIKAARLRPREDWGFFGPESPTWRVWTAPTALIGFQRSVVIEHFDPFLAAAVADSAGIYTNALRRFDRTLEYFLTVAIADSRTAIEASELLMKVHEKSTGTEPLSGRPYSANDPDSQLWIHVTGWHSVLLCYERYGPGGSRPTTSGATGPNRWSPPSCRRVIRPRSALAPRRPRLLRRRAGAVDHLRARQ